LVPTSTSMDTSSEATRPRVRRASNRRTCIG
jgi:hypothetical protein